MRQATLGTAVALGIAAAAATGPVAAQSKIELVNEDAKGVGLNDETPAQPVGGNPGRTLGEQRRIAYQYAMDLWGALLTSKQTILVQASFSPLECSDDGVILGGANAISQHMDFVNAPLAGKEYPAAMANALAGADLAPGRNDINTVFNSDLATEACGSSEWFYGLYGNADNAKGGSNFLNVIMHEIGHGLGVAGGLSRWGDFLFGSTPAAYNEFSHSRQFGKSINELELDDLEKALTTVGDVTWTGKRANASSRLIADNREFLQVKEPAAAAGLYEFALAAFGKADSQAIQAGDIVLLEDNGAQTSQACGALANAEAVRGKIALIDRGGCEFGAKALNAQKAGAAAVVIANSEDSVFGGMGPGAVGDQVTLPVVSVSLSTGRKLRAGEVKLAGVTVDETQFYGVDASGRTRLYVNTQFEGGSTLSHVDRDMSPNALMEPSETDTLMSHIFVDVTPDMYQDLGWRLNRKGTAVLGGCDTGVPVLRDIGSIPGANLMAHQNVCKVRSRGSRSGYQRCMNDHALKLRDGGHISNAEVHKVRQCLATADRS